MILSTYFRKPLSGFVLLSGKMALKSILPDPIEGFPAYGFTLTTPPLDKILDMKILIK